MISKQIFLTDDELKRVREAFRNSASGLGSRTRDDGEEHVFDAELDDPSELSEPDFPRENYFEDPTNLDDRHPIEGPLLAFYRAQRPPSVYQGIRKTRRAG